jgi:hypothetical protein
MKQEDIDKKLIKHIFTTENFGTKKVLKEFCLKDIGDSKIDTVENYFFLSYNILCETNILINDELNPMYENIYKLDNVDEIIDILMASLQKYRSQLELLKKEVKSICVGGETLEDLEYIKEPYQLFLFQLSNTIDDLSNRLIKNDKTNPDINYKVILNPLIDENNMTVFVFKELLNYILKDNMEVVTNEFIFNIINKYNFMLDEDLENKGKTKNNIKRYVVNVLKLSKIIINEKNPYQITTIIDKKYKMNARTKVESISNILNGISRITSIPDEERNLIHKIFNFSN